MNEKISLNDTLSTLNSMITMCNYSIQQCNDENLRNCLIENRNNLENVQWDCYLAAKDKGYYVPAAPAGEADINEVKNSIA
ncbi:MAG: spore coat protein [Clostridia bacterium]|nr:spore coat protein [Clostridia bacterium]